jgi:murein DD-endopeptidase MepM/ murein hydrolase activator NlpD
MWRGRLPVISSSYRSSDRPDHRGVDQMYRRLPEDGGPPGKLKMPHHARRFYMPSGIPALAIADGVVTTAKMIGTGGYVVIEHGDGLRSQSMHLILNKGVKVGDRVKAGQPIGTIHYDTKSGKPDLTHLHFQLRKHGVIQDPAPYLAAARVMSMPFDWTKALLVVGSAAAVYLVARR